MQNDKFFKYIPLIYRILCSISTHASEFIKTLPQTAAIFTHANSSGSTCSERILIADSVWNSRYLIMEAAISLRN